MNQMYLTGFSQKQLAARILLLKALPLRSWPALPSENFLRAMINVSISFDWVSSSNSDDCVFYNPI
jgi:hypothetical protein